MRYRRAFDIIEGYQRKHVGIKTLQQKGRQRGQRNKSTEGQSWRNLPASAIGTHVIGIRTTYGSRVTPTSSTMSGDLYSGLQR